MGHPGYWRDEDGESVEPAQAEQAWADQALPVLREVATVYGALIDYPGFADEVQKRSGIRTRIPVVSWIGGVLRVVMRQAREGGEPPLTVLVVPKIDGSVGSTLDSRPRLMCYHRYGAIMPDDAVSTLAGPPPKTGSVSKPPAGARPATRRTSRPAVPAGPSTPASRLEAPPRVCPRCFLALPATGVCDSCG